MYKSLADLKPKPTLEGQLSHEQGRAIADAIRNYKINPCCQTSKALTQATKNRLGTPIWRDDDE